MDQPNIDPIDYPTLEASEDAEYLEYYAEIKTAHQLVPSCRRAIFDEEAMNMSIALRIMTYSNGWNWFIGKQQDHGPPMVGEVRTKAQRVRAVLKAKRQDLLRQSGLYDNCDIETVALTFHGHLFDQGTLLTESGGIPGCPGPLTTLQRESCRASMEATTDYMLELHWRKMLHMGDRASAEIRPGQKFSDKGLILAAAELSRCCDDQPVPKYAVAQYSQLFAKDADVAPRPAGVVVNTTPAVVKEQATSKQVVPLESVLLPDVKRVPGDVCIKARTFVRGHSAATLECPDETCVLGSIFLRELRPGDNIRPETSSYSRLTFKDAGSKSRMRTGICDLRHIGAKKFWHLDSLCNWPGIKADMSGYGFIPGIKGHGSMTVGVKNYVRGDVDPGPPHPNGTQRQAFSCVHLGSPGGGVLVIHCNYNGRKYDGHEIPEEMLELLADANIIKVQFGIKDVLSKLTAGGVVVKSWVEAKNITMIAYPQPSVQVTQMKSGNPFVADILDAPTKLFSIQIRDREQRKARAGGSSTPLSDPLPVDIPNFRAHQATIPLYSERERQLRRDFWDLTENPQELPIDFDADDFTMTSTYYNTRMILHIAHQHSLVCALNWRMAYRAAKLHNISLEGDANRYSQLVLMSLRNVEAFANGTSPSARAFQPLGDNEWMDSEASRPDMPLRASPYYASGGFSGQTSTKCIANYMDQRLYHSAIDPMGLTRGFREDLKSLNRGKLEKPDLEFRVLGKFQRQKVRPHHCSRFGSGNHMQRSCLEPDTNIKCIYPRCKSDEHVIAVCPVVMTRCTGCKKLGHSKEDHPRTLWPVLINDYLAASYFHDLAILTCERLSVKMGTDAGEFIVIPKIDYSDDRYVPKQDRRYLSILPYDMPF